jgi:hypothetical protein
MHLVSAERRRRLRLGVELRLRPLEIKSSRKRVHAHLLRPDRPQVALPLAQRIFQQQSIRIRSIPDINARFVEHLDEGPFAGLVS